MNAIVKGLSTTEIKEEIKQNLTREEQLSNYGYITVRDLTHEEIQALPKCICILAKRQFKKADKTVSNFYSFKAYFEKGFPVDVNMSSNKLKPRPISEDEFASLCTMLGCKTDEYDLFEVSLPYRLLCGSSQKDHKKYYKYEIILGYSESSIWFASGFFNREKVVLIEMNNELLNKFILTKSLVVEDDNVN